VKNLTDGSSIHLIYITMHKALETPADAVNLHTFVYGCPNYRSNGGIHSRCIAAACQYPDLFHIFKFLPH
jgi:hypothetical protein